MILSTLPVGIMGDKKRRKSVSLGLTSCGRSGGQCGLSWCWLVKKMIGYGVLLVKLSQGEPMLPEVKCSFTWPSSHPSRLHACSSCWVLCSRTTWRMASSTTDSFWMLGLQIQVGAGVGSHADSWGLSCQHGTKP